MTRPDHDLSLLKGDTSSWPMDLSAGAEPPGPATSPALQRQALSPSIGKLVVRNKPAQATKGPEA